MIDSLAITNFRCFERFEAQGLARVNLLEGTNNCGKTSLLEAVELLETRVDAEVLLNMLLHRRGGIPIGTTDQRMPDLPVQHLFHGHALEPGQSFEITASRAGAQHGIRALVESNYLAGPRQSSFAREDVVADPRPGPLVLRIRDTGDESPAAHAIADWRLGAQGGLSPRDLPWSTSGGVRVPVRFIPTCSLRTAEVASLFGAVALTEQETQITEALQIIDPTIERVALAVGDAHVLASNLFVRCKGQSQRLPIGIMSDGIQRLLALALALVNTRGGILLIDEIDTGLHFSVMSDMWKLVLETAQRLDVQVFATSHSRDCYESLAEVLHETGAGTGTAVIHRIERELGRTVVFDEPEIIIAADRGIEVR